MKVRKRLLDATSAGHLFLFQMLGVHAQMRLNILLGDSK
jgi:hypothetical protein